MNNERKEELSQIKRIIDGIYEQCEKEQFWNAIGRTTLDLLPLLMRCFDKRLQRGGSLE